MGRAQNRLEANGGLAVDPKMEEGKGRKNLTRECKRCVPTGGF